MLTNKLLLIIIFFLFLPFVLASTIDVTPSVKSMENLMITVTPDAQGVNKYYYIYQESINGTIQKHIGAFPYSEDIGYTTETISYQIPVDWESGTYYVAVYSYSISDWIKEYFDVVKITPVAPNKKSMSKYSNKEVFLISDSDRTKVLPFISVTTWTGNEGCNKGHGTPSNVCVYPTLVFHEEIFEEFDADSIIYFIQKYSPSRVTIIGDTPIYLDNLLITSPNFGAGLRPENIQRINVYDYPSYWETFDTLVYVEDNYELALLASTYASLINAPLIIAGKGLDYAETFDGRNVICVGGVSPPGSSCIEQYTLGQLRQKYKDKTNTKKVILINHNDWVTYENIVFLPDKSPSFIFDLYTKTSLMAPILASAKHELILSTTEKNSYNIDNFIEPLLSGMSYLTIMAAPNVIPQSVFEWMDPLGEQIHRSLDQTQYADMNNDMFPDIATGRIMGISSSDVSSYVARSLFYNTFSKTNNMKFLASSFTDFINQANMWSSIFRSSGYNSIVITSEKSSYKFDSNEWKNQDLISYQDHGSFYWAGIYSWAIPPLENSMIFSDACLTCSRLDRDSFCHQAIREGALAYMGAVSVAFTKNLIYMRTMNNIYQAPSISKTITTPDSFSTIGDSFRSAYDTNRHHYMTTLIGDPTLNIKPSHRLTRSLGICKVDGEDCENDSECCASEGCIKGTCGCQPKDEDCDINSDCCGNALVCIAGKCDDCRAIGEACGSDYECCTRTCEGGLCRRERGATTPANCAGIGEFCWTKYDCCTRRCEGLLWWAECKKPNPPSGGGGCFVGDTKINTPNGFIAIDQLQEGDLIYSYSREKNKIIETRVKKKIIHDGINEYYHDYDKWKLLEVEFSNGIKLKVTANHAFITENSKWEEIEDINIGERFIYNNNGNPEFVSLLSKKELKETPIVYNIITDDENHNYFSESILAHNGGGGK